MQKKMKKLLLLVFAFTCFAGCEKRNNDETTLQTHEFKGLAVINDMGQVMGTWGTEDGDWGTDSVWSAGEYELLNFPDTISLDGTFLKDTSGWNIGPGIHEQPQNVVIVYPNPVKNTPTLIYHGLGLLKFKATIVDKYYHRMFTYACKDSLAYMHLDLSDSTKFVSGTIYRLYYSISAKDSVNFIKGHGDILICRENAVQDCQKFVP
jgi:hypothetical protein